MEIPGNPFTDKAMSENNDKLTRLVRAYERKLEEGASIYMEAYEFADIIEYYTLNQREFEAENCMRIALRLHPDDEDLLLQKAYLLKNAGRWKEAYNLVASKIGKQQRSYKMFMLEYALAHSYYHSACDLLQEILQVEPKDFDFYDTCEEAAEIFYDYSFYEKSVELLRPIPDTFDRYKQSTTLLAASYFRIGEYEKGVSLLNMLIDADPYNITLWAELAEGQLINHRYKEAIDSCDYALAIEPQEATAMRVKIKCCSITGDFNEVVQLGNQYIQSCPAEPSILITVAEAYYAREDFIDALHLINEAYSICPIDSMERPRILLCHFKCLVGLGQQDAMLLNTIRTTLPYGYYYFKVYLTISSTLFEMQDAKIGIEILRLALQCEGIDREEQAKVLLQLFSYRQFAPVKDLWMQLSHLFEHTTYAPFLAYAFRKLRMPYAHFMEQACAMAPDTTKELFADEYPGTGFDKYIETAEEEDQLLSRSGGWGKLFPPFA